MLKIGSGRRRKDRKYQMKLHNAQYVDTNACMRPFLKMDLYYTNIWQFIIQISLLREHYTWNIDMLFIFHSLFF